MVLSAQTNNVSFAVDMNDYTGSFTTVYVSGDFNSWSGNGNALSDSDGDGVWTGTIPIAADSIEFKYTLDNWTGQEQLTPGSSCTKSAFGFTNRFVVISGTTVVPQTCFASCFSCNNQVDVTFQVDMSNQSSYTNVYVSGTFNNWSGNANQLLDSDNDGVYTATISLAPGSYEYKFNVDNWAGEESLNPSK